jgi:ABC-2 type transport system permease protein
MFPFMGMPAWARFIGEAVPLTHTLRICRGVLLKGNGFDQIWPDLWPMAVFAIVVGGIAVSMYRETLDCCDSVKALVAAAGGPLPLSAHRQ